MKPSLRLIFLYIFTSLGLILSIVGLVKLTDLAIKVFIFTGADSYEYYQTKPLLPDGTQDPTYDIQEARAIEKRELMRNRQRTVSEALAMILIGVPLYIYHWRIIQKEDRQSIKG